MKGRVCIIAILGLLLCPSVTCWPVSYQVSGKDHIRLEQRVALVIGNGKYNASPLANPINDSRDMSKALRDVGFEVTERQNLTKDEMKKEIKAFGLRLRSGGIGLFYFAGHGIQLGGRNYLVPVDAEIMAEEQVEFEAVEVGILLAEMVSAQNRLNVVILDACRNNPFAHHYRSTVRGLAVMNAPVETLIAYATAPDSIASDGAGKNGLYTQELLAQVRVPGLKLEDVFKRVRSAVRTKSRGAQVPWEVSSLEGDFYFRPTNVQDEPEQTRPQINKDEPRSDALVQSVKGSLWLAEGFTSDNKPVFYEFEPSGVVKHRAGYDGLPTTPSNMTWYQTADRFYLVQYAVDDRGKIHWEFSGTIKGNRIEGECKDNDSGKGYKAVFSKIIK